MTRAPIPLSFVAILAGCTSDPVVAGADTPDVAPCDPAACDDGDPCTDDGCDRTGTMCTFVPLDVLDACRVDAHCDDQDRCTVDQCAPNACGAIRCRHEPIRPCMECTTAAECVDLDPATIDECLDGLCSFAPEPHYDPTCDFSVEPPPGMVRTSLYSHLGWACDACPCDIGSIFVAETFEGPYPADIPGATCTIRCGEQTPDGSRQIACEPLIAGASYRAWARLESGRLKVDDWCLVDPVPNDRPSRGTLRVDAVTRAVELTRRDYKIALRCLDASCAPLFDDEQLLDQASISEAPVYPLRFEVMGRDVVAKLLPSATGARGRIVPYDLTATPIDGELSLELDDGPVPTGH